MSLYDDASLVMIPSGKKDGKLYSIKPTDGSGDFTFSRDGAGASPATRVDSDGNIETGRTNFLLQSDWDDVGLDTAPTSWTSSIIGSGTYDAGASTGQIRFTAPTGSDRGFIVSTATTATGIMTLSVKVDTIHTSGATIQNFFGRTGGTATTVFYLENNLEVAGSTVMTAGNTYAWVLDVTAGASWRIGAGSSAGEACDLTVSEPQIEMGLVRTDYIETTTTEGYGGLLGDMPRLDYSGGATCPSLLLEPSRTNMIPNIFIPETETDVTLTYNYGTSPMGVQNSLQVQKDGVSANDRIEPVTGLVAVSGTDYYISVFLKNVDVADSSGVTTVGARCNSGTLFRQGFTWVSGVPTISGTGDSGTRVNPILEDWGNGWYRLGFGFEADSTNIDFELDIDRANSSATTSLEYFGAQIEEGTYPTSLIPTYGSTVTRARDVVINNTYPSTILPTQGTFFFALKNAISANVTDIMFALSDNNSASNTMGLYVANFATGTVRIRNRQANADLIIYDFDPENATVAITFGAFGMELFINGVSVASDTTPYSGYIDTIGNGSVDTGTVDLKRSVIWDTILSDDEILELHNSIA